MKFIKLAVVSASFSLVALAPVSATIFVAPAPVGSNTTGTGTAAKPYATIQHAYNVSPIQGETISVAPGTYNECVNATGMLVQTAPGVFDEKWVKIVASSANNAATTIHGNNLCTTVTIGGLGGRLEGFTINGGGDSGVHGVGTVAIVDNNITGNIALDGGGIRISSTTCQHGPGTVLIEANNITGNTATDDGGGIVVLAGASDADCQAANVSVTVTGNVVQNNTAADDGGGIQVESTTLEGLAASVTISGNTVRGNSATTGCCSLGGGIRVRTAGTGTETIQVLDNVVDQNTTAADGGGILARIEAISQADHVIVIDGNSVTANVAAGDGGGIHAKTDVQNMLAGQRFDMYVTDNFVNGNSAGGNGFGGGGMLARFAAFSTRVESAVSGRFVVAGNTITHNQTGQVGGGLSISAESNVDATDPGGCEPTTVDASSRIDVWNNLIARNTASNPFPPARAAGVAVLSQACTGASTTALIDLLLNTIADNQTSLGAGGIEIGYFSIAGGYTAINLSHNIVSGNQGEGIGGLPPTTSYALGIDHNDVIGSTSTNYVPWIGNRTGLDGNVALFPRFVDPNVDNYHLQGTSPVIDLGNPVPGYLPQIDFDGQPRVADGNHDSLFVVDMGCDEYLVCSDPDSDGFGLPSDDCGKDNCPSVFNPGQSDCDNDLLGDACDASTVDADGDGVAVPCDANDANANVCGDFDADGCQDCQSGKADPGNDGPDSDNDGLCDLGDPDDDNDSVPDASDTAPLDPHVCQDLDSDACDDCALGAPSVSNDGPDYDGDGLCNVGDPDDDNDGAPDAADAAPFDKFHCHDLDGDTCDDCTSGTANPANDGPDADGEGICDAADPDDDNDGVPDAADPVDNDSHQCGDVDADLCDDCAVGVDGVGPLPDSNPGNDGDDFDGDGQCDLGDPDDDNDGQVDPLDAAPFDYEVCGDSDADGCDDCTGGLLLSIDAHFDTNAEGFVYADDTFRGTNQPNFASGSYQPTGGFSGGGLRVDLGGINNNQILGMSGGFSRSFQLAAAADLTVRFRYNLTLANDYEGDEFGEVLMSFDGVLVGAAPFDYVAHLADGGSTGWQQFEIQLGNKPAGTHTIVLGGYNNKKNAANEFMNVRFDDVQVQRGHGESYDPLDDGADLDADGKCDTGDNCPSVGNPGQEDNDDDGSGDACDVDDDNDGVNDSQDVAPFDKFHCQDVDADTCDDCLSGTANPAADGSDLDADGLCDAGDPDDDNDSVPDAVDCLPLNGSVGTPAPDVGNTLRFGPGRTRLSWLKTASANVYNVYRGVVGADAPFAYNHTCLLTEVPATEALDATVPAPGQFVYYLVSGTNVCGGDGSVGTDSAGAARPLPVVCTPKDLDSEADGVKDINDNCPLASNPTQQDVDYDGRGDACDNCPAATNVNQKDSDVDGPGDACDTCTDTDGDGIGDPGYAASMCGVDNCPQSVNPDQVDADADGLGDACDACQHDPANNSDGDGLCGDVDNCPNVANQDQADLDQDGLGDSCDPCFSNPAACVACPAGTDADGDGLCQIESVVAVEGTPVKYLANYVDPGIPGIAWTAQGYPTGSWSSGVYGIGYDTGAPPNAEGLITTAIAPGAHSIYTVRTFDVASAAAVKRVLAHADYDDAYMVWINGIEVYRSPLMPATGNPTWNVPLQGQTEPSNGADPVYGPPNNVSGAAIPALHNGTNTLAIGVWNVSGGSSDLLIVPRVVIETSIDNCPGLSNPSGADADQDGVGDACDNCPLVAGLDQTDNDGDGKGNLCDPCINDPAPGCGICPPGTDSDNDGVCQVEVIAVQEGTAMQYLPNSVDPGLGLTWKDELFVPGGQWGSGIYGVGYDSPSQNPNALNLISTTVTNTAAISVYTRATFQVTDASAISGASVGCDYDDGYMVWINGVEAFRSSEMPQTGNPNWNTLASSHESSNGANPNYGTLKNVSAAALAALHNGTNVVAIGVWNATPTSSDLVLVPFLSLKEAGDNCPSVPNPGQEDGDGDGVGDACDPTP